MATQPSGTVKKTVGGDLEHWTRGYSASIGPHGGKNQYRLGVCIENWVEDKSAHDGSAEWPSGTARSPLTASFGTRFNAVSNMTDTIFRPEGKTGRELLQAGDRVDLDPHQKLSVAHKFPHGSNPSETHFVTMNQLAYKAPETNGATTAKYMWSGSKFSNSLVVQNSHLQTSESPIRDAYYQKLREERHFNPYRSTTQGDLEKTATIAVGADVRPTLKRKTAMKFVDGHQDPTVGRKVTGGFVKQADASSNPLKFTVPPAAENVHCPRDPCVGRKVVGCFVKEVDDSGNPLKFTVPK